MVLTLSQEAEECKPLPADGQLVRPRVFRQQYLEHSRRLAPCHRAPDGRATAVGGSGVGPGLDRQSGPKLTLEREIFGSARAAREARAVVVVLDECVDQLEELCLLDGFLDAPVRALHTPPLSSSTSALFVPARVSTFCGIHWVVSG
jgi:hypothetical protein